MEKYKTIDVIFFESKKYPNVYVCKNADKDKFLPNKLKVYIDKCFGNKLKFGTPYKCKLKFFTNEKGYEDFSIVEIYGTYKRV